MTLQVSVGTQFRFVAATGFSPADPATDWTIGTPTAVLLTLAGLTDDQARQSTKFDFGANRALKYECLAAIDFTGETPTAGFLVEFYFLPSTHATDANGNIAGNSGLDNDAPHGAVGPPTLDEFIALADMIGSLICHGDSVVQNGKIGVLSPSSRYGQLMVVNRSGDLFEGDNVEHHVVLNAIDMADG